MDQPCMRVLVVDDIESSRRDLAACVQQEGYPVVLADSGEQALHVVRNDPPDLVLVDLLMPGVDGFEVITRLRALRPQRWIPAIATSSLVGDEHFIEAVRRGADDYLARPVSPPLLHAKLRHYASVLALQRRLEGLAARQREIHDNILDAVITLDAQGLVVEANQAARALAPGTDPSLEGWPVQTLLGVTMDELLNGQVVELRPPGRASFVAEIAASRWREGAATLTTLVVRDLTERHRNERMRDEFLAMVSHELRTPLTSIVGAVSLLASRAAGPVPAAAEPLLAAAHRNGLRLSKLVDDMLDLTKLEADRLTLRPRTQSLRSLLREAISAHQALAAKAEVTLESRFDEACDDQVHVDADRLLQVLANLLSNAVKHSPSGAPVTVTMGPQGQGLAVTVRDRGPGVPEDFRARLFEKFAQADGSDQRSVGGTGLGLHVARLLAERMRGALRLEPSDGAGAAFTLWLPWAQQDSGAVLQPRVLHVDLDADARRRVRAMLAGLAEVESVAVLSADLQGPFAAVLANPRGQGAADRFCATLREAAQGASTWLLSDAVDDAFVAAQGMRRLSPSQLGAQGLRDAVVTALRAQRAPGGTA